ncbi:hypothetical protein [Hymenobacter daeguensis]
MELRILTKEFIKHLQSQKGIDNLLDAVLNMKKENDEAILAKGFRLDTFNNETAALQDFRKDLKFIEEGINGSWKDDVTNDDTQEYYWSLQKQVEKILDNIKARNN